MTFKNLVKEETFKSVSESEKLIIIHKLKPLIWGKMLIMLIRWEKNGNKESNETKNKLFYKNKKMVEGYLKRWYKNKLINLIQFMNQISS